MRGHDTAAPEPQSAGVDTAAEHIGHGVDRRRVVGYCLGVFLIVRVSISLVGLTVGTLSANQPPQVPDTSTPASTGWHNFWDATDRLDAAWFTGIADEGYRLADGAAAFFPLYPLAIRIVSAVPGVSTLAAAYLVSNLAFLASLILLYLLTADELSEGIARRSVTLLAVFPTSFFFLAPYSESLYLMLTLLAFRSLRSRRWGVGGAVGALAAATRSVGIALVPAFLVEAWDRRGEGSSTTRARVLAAFGVVLGPLAYLAWWSTEGNLKQPFVAQAGWERGFALFPATLGRGLAQAIGALDRPDGGYWVSDLLLTSVVIAGCLAIRRSAAPTYLAFAAASLLIPLSYPYLGRDLSSMSRFVIVVFPAFWGIATWCRRPWVYVTLLVASSCAWIWHAVLFMHWRHIY